jgi:hypothetical protein
MRILKTEIHDLHDEGASGSQDGQQPQAQPVPPQQLVAPAAAPPPGVQYTAPAAAPVYTAADGVPAAPAAPAAAPPVAVPVPEVQQDTRPA